MLSANTTDFFLLTKESVGLKSGKGAGLTTLGGAPQSSPSDVFLFLMLCS